MIYLPNTVEKVPEEAIKENNVRIYKDTNEYIEKMTLQFFDH